MPTHSIAVREVLRDDALELSELLNAIIARGGTTAFEVPFTPQSLSEYLFTGPDVLSCQ